MRSLIIISLFLLGGSLNLNAQDSLSTSLLGLWNHDTAQFNDVITVQTTLTNTGDSNFVTNDLFIHTLIYNTSGQHLVSTDSTYQGGLILSFPGDTASATLSWIVDPLKYMPGINITVVWPVNSLNSIVTTDSMKLITVVDTSNGIKIHTVPLTLDVFPNPAQDRLFITGQDAFSIRHIRIYDMQGRIVLTPAPSTTVDIRALQKGMYVILIGDRNGRRSAGRFIKE